MTTSEPTGPRLLCVGDLNADIAITPDGSLVPGTDTPGRIALAAGGSAANVAAESARLGVPTRFAGVVGDDALGRLLADDLHRRGIDVRCVFRSGTTSRSIAALIGVDGDRSMVSDLSTDTVLRPRDIASSWFDDATWLHLTAYTWFPDGGPATWERIVGLATERDIPWTVDPSSARMLVDGRGPADAAAAFAGADVIFPSQDEATALTGSDDPTTAAQQLLDLADTAVVTSGANGVTVARRGQPAFHCDAPDAVVVNTLGCGDAFAAGFIAGRLSGVDDRECAERGLASATRVLGLASAR